MNAIHTTLPVVGVVTHDTEDGYVARYRKECGYECTRYLDLAPVPERGGWGHTVAVFVLGLIAGFASAAFLTGCGPDVLDLEIVVSAHDSPTVGECGELYAAAVEERAIECGRVDGAQLRTWRLASLALWRDMGELEPDFDAEACAAAVARAPCDGNINPPECELPLYFDCDTVSRQCTESEVT